MTAVNGPSEAYWNPDFQGIYRANLLIQKISGGVSGMDDAVIKRYVAEAKTLRAYFNFELIRLFKNIPLITEPLEPSQWFNVTQATREEVYAQIEKDLKEAVDVLPTKSAMASSEMGRMDKECAEALLGKAILFQNDETRMKEAAGWFNKVNTAAGYALCPNFKDIFDPANKFNSESVFEITHTASQQQGDWGAKIFGNMKVLKIVFGCIALFLASCGNGNNNGTSDDNMTLSADSLKFDYSASSQSLSVVATNQWSVSSDQACNPDSFLELECHYQQ